MDTQDVQKALARDKEALQRLEEERLHLLSRIAIHNHNLSRLSRLPLELLVAIFVFCLPEGRTMPRPHHAPLLICQVSSAWRNFAISTPSLWAVLALPASPNDRSSALALFDLYARRSNPRPLSIDIVQDEPYAYLDDHFAGSVFGLMTSCAQRLKRIDIDSFDALDQLRFFSVLPEPLTTLHHLGLAVQDGDAKGQLANWMGAFARAPVLTSLKLLFRDSGESLAEIPLPWQQIRDLELDVHSRSLDDIMTVMADSPYLTICWIVISAGETPSIRPRIVQLPNLKKLAIASECTLGSFLESISCPSLEDLSLLWSPSRRVNLRGYSPTRSIAALGAGPCLQQLNLGNIPLPVEDLVHCLRNTFNLVDLRLTAGTPAHVHGSEVLLAELTW